MNDLPKAQLITIFATLAKLPESNVRWSDDTRPHPAPKPGALQGTLTLTALASEALGEDDIRTTSGAAEEGQYPGVAEGTYVLDYEQVSWRIVTLSLTAELFLGKEGIDALENIRRRIRRPTASQALQALGMVFVDAETVRKNEDLGIRQGSTNGILDVRFSQTIPEKGGEVNEDYWQGVPGGWIETVEVEDDTAD